MQPQWSAFFLVVLLLLLSNGNQIIELIMYSRMTWKEEEKTCVLPPPPDRMYKYPLCVCRSLLLNKEKEIKKNLLNLPTRSRTIVYHTYVHPWGAEYSETRKEWEKKKKQILFFPHDFPSTGSPPRKTGEKFNKKKKVPKVRNSSKIYIHYQKQKKIGKN